MKVLAYEKALPDIYDDKVLKFALELPLLQAVDCACKLREAALTKFLSES